MVSISQYAGYIFGFPVETNTRIQNELQTHIKYLKPLPKKFLTLRTDNGTDFKNEAMTKFAEMIIFCTDFHLNINQTRTDEQKVL